ncbi:hypothetical protein GGS24DRAFT_502376 [Hypoxylon argillaceum]|nr:hypothetical protein GGS24DRAFT_502376 [Hypoxylon argillaceum]
MAEIRLYSCKLVQEVETFVCPRQFVASSILPDATKTSESPALSLLIHKDLGTDLAVFADPSSWIEDESGLYASLRPSFTLFDTNLDSGSSDRLSEAKALHVSGTQELRRMIESDAASLPELLSLLTYALWVLGQSGTEAGLRRCAGRFGALVIMHPT